MVLPKIFRTEKMKHRTPITRGFTSTSMNMSVGTQGGRGFTLVELIVSLALFIIVVFIVTSAFLTIANLYKKAQTTRIAMDNLSVALESMVRNIRTGSFYNCVDNSSFYKPTGAWTNTISPGGDCASGGDYLIYQAADGSVMGYTRFGKSGGAGCDPANGKICVRKNDSLKLLTGSDIIITNLKFYVTGTALGSSDQPHVAIVVQGIAGNDPRTQSKFSIYTSVTQRIPK
jgi:type II secretory pathway pseudopilin PulG